MTLRDVLDRLLEIREDCPLIAECSETGESFASAAAASELRERFDVLVSDLEHAVRAEGRRTR